MAAAAAAAQVAGQFDDADDDGPQPQVPTRGVEVGREGRPLDVCVSIAMGDGWVHWMDDASAWFDPPAIQIPTLLNTSQHTQSMPLPSPPTEGEDWEEEEGWEGEEDDEDDELDEDAYAALEGLLLGEAGGGWTDWLVGLVGGSVEWDESQAYAFSFIKQSIDRPPQIHTHTHAYTQTPSPAAAAGACRRPWRPVGWRATGGSTWCVRKGVVTCDRLGLFLSWSGWMDGEMDGWMYAGGCTSDTS